MAGVEQISHQPMQGNDTNVTVSPEVKHGAEASELKKDTQKALRELQESLKNGEMTPILAKKIIESLKDIPSDKKTLILAGLLGRLNKIGIAIKGVKNGEIELTHGKENFIGKPNIATRDEVVSYQNIINNHLSSGFFTVTDLHEALLYRTTGLEVYINEKIDGQKLSTHEYALRLLKKYNISVVVKSEQNNEISSKIGTAAYYDTLFTSEAVYLGFKNELKGIITDNSSDKEFLLTYFDDIYYSKGKHTQDGSVEKYKKTTDANEKAIIKGLNKLTDSERYALGIRDSNEAKELAKKWKNDPLGALGDAFKNGGGLLGVLLGIIGGIFWGKKGMLGGFLGGMVLGGGGTAFADEMLKGIGRKGEKQNGESVSESEEIVGNQPIYKKFESEIKGINTETKEQEKNLEVWKTLSSNDKLMSTSLTELQEILKDETKTKDFLLNTCKFDGVFLLQNEERIKKVYETLLKERKNSIGDFKEGENLKKYLERTSESGTKIAGGAALPQEKTKLASNQREYNGWVSTGTFNEKGDLINGERRNKENTKIETFIDGKLTYIYEGEFINGKFNGVVRYNDNTGRVEIYKEGEKLDYTLEYIGGLMGLLGITLAPSAAGPVGVVASGAIGIGYSVADLMNQDEDFLWDILKTAHIVDPRFEGGKKTFWDNAFAAMGLIPGMRQLGLAAKIASYTSKLPPDKLAKVTEISGKVAESLKNTFKIGEKTTEVIVKNFGIADDVVNGLKTGETTVQKMKINGEITEVTFKKTPKGGLAVHEIKNTDGTSIKGLKEISEFCKGKKFEVVSDVTKVEKIALSERLISSISSKFKEKGIPENVKLKVIEILKQGAFWGFVGTSAEGGLNYMSGEYDEKSILNIALDLGSMYVKWGLIGAGTTQGLILAKKGVDGTKKLLSIGSKGATETVSSIPHKKAVIGTTIIGGVVYEIFSGD